MNKLPISVVANYTFYVISMAIVGAVFGYGWSKKETILELWYSANEQRYLVMAGEVGPVTYLVYHDDYSILENASKTNEDILGVEMHEFPDIAVVAFRDRETESISQVNQLPGIRKMVRKHVPMICQ